MKPIISIEDVWKIYQMGEVEVPALRGVSVKIDKGDFVAIVGASGSGKSTMMNIVGCLDIPSKGKVYLKSQDVSKMSESKLSSLRGKTIGFIFQQYHLIPTMTAYENVILSLEMLEVDDRIASEKAKKVLEDVGLGDKIHHRPKQMSGGQQQRVAIARALVSDPEIILADEPTGNLDTKTGATVMSFLKKLHKEGKTIVMVTHDLELARFSYRLIELKDGEIIRDEKNKKFRGKGVGK